MSGRSMNPRIRLGIILSFAIILVVLFCSVVLFSVFFIQRNGDEEKYFGDQNLVSASLVSPFGTNEFRCTGTCSCEREYPSESRRRSVSGIMKHSTFYLVSAVSSIVAYKLFKDYLTEECSQEFENCPLHAIESSVEDCEERLFTESSTNEKSNVAGQKLTPKARPRLRLDPFCERQFDDDYDGTRIPMDKQEFFDEVVKMIEENDLELKDGYAPFCKHYFVPNFANCDAGYVKIDEETEKLIETKYHSRRDDELPVLVRYIRKERLKEVPKGKYLDIILYSREQIDLENEAMGHEKEEGGYDYGIISVNCIFQNCEVPMNPITCMRNALGKEFGGSGKPIDEKDYRDSVDFWKDNVSIG